jgi:protein SCO1/2
MCISASKSNPMLSVTVGLALALAGANALAAEGSAMDHAHMDHSMMDHSQMDHSKMDMTASATADPHAAHHHMMEQASESGVRRSQAAYVVPDLRMVREDGKLVNLRGEIDDGRPVFVNFIFTTCTTICPVSSQIYSMLQRKLAADSTKVHLVSVSIDPEQDTPPRLREYAARFHAGKSWSHYTGSVEASVQVQKAFAAYQGDKMNHTPLTLYRAAPGQPWVRLDGFADADQLLAEFRPAAAHP